MGCARGRGQAGVQMKATIKHVSRLPLLNSSLWPAPPPAVWCVCSATEPSNLDRFLAAGEQARRILVFSGSGLSATSGMSTFSTRGGLYERAQKQFGLADGKTLFTYSFFDRRRPEAQAFFLEIRNEAVRAHPAPGHHALAQLHAAGRLQRHYTLNVDGLAERVSMDTWHPETNPEGATVELHGSVHALVCPECGGSEGLGEAAENRLRDQLPVPCRGCGHDAMRFKMMMYEDAEGRGGGWGG
jgi:NAD-dependent SIR2 family protein deacetylase